MKFINNTLNFNKAVSGGGIFVTEGKFCKFVNNKFLNARVNYGGGKTFKLDRNWKKNPELIKIYDRLIDKLVDSGYFTEDQVKLLENGEEIT